MEVLTILKDHVSKGRSRFANADTSLVLCGEASLYNSVLLTFNIDSNKSVLVGWAGILHFAYWIGYMVIDKVTWCLWT